MTRVAGATRRRRGIRYEDRWFARGAARGEFGCGIVSLGGKDVRTLLRAKVQLAGF